MLNRVRLFGLDFISCQSEGEIVAELLDLANDEQRRLAVPFTVVTPNVDQLVRLDRHEDSVAEFVIRSAHYVVPDGQPVVWASKILKRPIVARIAGSTLVASLWPQSIEHGLRSVVIAPSDAVAQKINDENQRSRVFVAPNFEMTDLEAIGAWVAKLMPEISSNRPTLCFVTLGFPKRCRVIDEMIKHWPTGQPYPVFLAIGGSFEMYYGLRRRAPHWIQRVGFEWLFRLAQDPRYLWRRYLVDDPHFFKMVWRNRHLRHTVDVSGVI